MWEFVTQQHTLNVATLRLPLCSSQWATRTAKLLRWCWCLWFPPSCSLWWPGDHLHSGHTPRRCSTPSPLAQASLTIGTGSRCELCGSIAWKCWPKASLCWAFLEIWCTRWGAPWNPRLCPGPRRTLPHPQLHPSRTHMLEDKGDGGAEALGVIVADKGGYAVWHQGGGDFPQQTPVCLLWNCLFLSIQDQGDFIQQLSHPRCGDKPYHDRICRTRTRLISGSAQHDPSFRWTLFL